VSLLTDLIAKSKAQNPQLGADLEREFRALSSSRGRGTPRGQFSHDLANGPEGRAPRTDSAGGSGRPLAALRSPRAPGPQGWWRRCRVPGDVGGAGGPSMSEGLDENNLPPGTAAHGWLAIGGERVGGARAAGATPSVTPRASGSARSRTGTPRPKASRAIPLRRAASAG